MSKAGDKPKGGEAEVQLADMQRKYRIMEGNRKNYSEDSQQIIKRQRGTIDKIKSDNVALNREIALFKEGGTMSETTKKAMAELQDEADLHLRKIEVERRRLEELDKQLHLAASKQEAQRRALGGVNATKEIDQQVQRQIKVLESRLDKALVKFNEALAHNKSLREEIDHLRRERTTFETIYKKLEKELHEKKKQMVNVIEISNIAYEARDQAQNEIAALRAQADKEETAYELEIREAIKALEDQVRQADLAKEASMMSVGSMTTEQESALKKKVMKNAWGFGKDRTIVDTAAEKVRAFDDAFAKIQAATGLTDINQLVTSFINAEDQNFSLFNFANELNQETEKLEEQVADLKAELEKAKGSDASKEGQRKQVLEDLTNEHESTCAKTEAYILKYGAGMNRIVLLKEAIISIFTAIGCTPPEDTEGVIPLKDSNMLMYLGIVEQRANEILQLQANAKMYVPSAPSSSGARGHVLGEGPSAPQGSSNVEILPPSTADDHHSEEDSDEDIDDRPLTRDELQARTLRNLHKKESRGAARLRKKMK